MKRGTNKSHCAVNFALEAVGDPWSLLVVRDIAFNGKHTFKEFLASDERIATNVLSSRLNHLEVIGVLAKKPHPSDGRAGWYDLAEKGADLIPAILELSNWSFTYDPATEASPDFAAIYRAHRPEVTERIRQGALEGRAAFAGEHPVFEELLHDYPERSSDTVPRRH